jgi:hypothetical protein
MLLQVVFHALILRFPGPGVPTRVIFQVARPYLSNRGLSEELFVKSSYRLAEAAADHADLGLIRVHARIEKALLRPVVIIFQGHHGVRIAELFNKFPATAIAGIPIAGLGALALPAVGNGGALMAAVARWLPPIKRFRAQ